jgi:ABC-type sugar transport system substrate-binding protein
MVRSSPRLMVSALTTSALVVLAACGSSTKSSSSNTATSPAPTTTIAAAPTAPATTQVPATTAAATVAATAAPATTAAPSTKPATKSLRIGFIPPSLGIPAFQGLKAGLEGMGGGQFGDKVIAEDAKFDPTSQLQTIQQWVKLGQIDALWVIPVAAPTLAPVLTEATAKGIVVVAGGKPKDYGFDGPQAGITYSDIDNVAFGKGIGDMMAKCVTGRLGGKASVIYAGPASANESTTNINKSSADALAAGAPGAKIVPENRPC